MGKLYLFMVIVIGVLLSNCKTPNTTDPQVSISVEEAKKNNLFVSFVDLEIQFENESPVFFENKGWIEKKWKYEKKSVVSDIKIEIREGNQLIIPFLLGSDFVIDDYLESWWIQDSLNNRLGLSSSFLTYRFTDHINNNKIKFEIIKDSISVGKITCRMKREVEQ